MAIISRVIQSKVIIVAAYQNVSYGYDDSVPFGDIRDAEYGVTSKSASLYGFGDDEIKRLFYSSTLDVVRFYVGGANTVTNTADDWTSITIGSTTYTRASGTFVTSSSPFYWEWAASGTNPFGTTSGAAVDVDINLDVDNAAGSSAISVSNPYLTNGSASTVTVSFLSGLATNQSYRLYAVGGGEIEGSNAYGETVGYTSDGTTSQTITLSSQYLPINNSLVTYQVQTSGRYVPEDAPIGSWTDVAGDRVNTRFGVQRGEVATGSSNNVPPVIDIRFGQNASYTTRTVDLSRFAGMDVHIVFHHELPDPTNGSFVYTADLQIDNVQFDGNTYSFENSGQGWQTTTIGKTPISMPNGGGSGNWSALAVGTTAERWNVHTGNTGSANTGNLGATAGSYYVYTETSSPVVAGDGFWLRSPLVTLSGSPGNLTFDEGRQGANIGTLRTFVHVVDTNKPDLSIRVPQERVIPNNETSFSAEILGGSGRSGASTNTTYQIRTTSFSGPVVGSAVGAGSSTTKIAVSDAPSSRTTKTYYVTAFLTSSGSSTVASLDSFDVQRGGVAPTSAIYTVSLATKYISANSTGGSTGAAYGYRRGDGSTLGDIGNTSSFVTSDGSLSSIWASTSFSARQIVFVTNNIMYHDELRFKVQGNPGNGIDWTRLRIADSSTTSTTTGREFKQTDAIYTYNPSLDETTWIWTNDRNENPLTGASEYTAEIVKELNAGYQLSISNTSLTGTQTDSSSAVFSSAEAFAQYKIIKTSGTTPGGTADGATVGSFAGGNSGFTISIGTNDQPSAGQTCNYKVQFKSRYGNDSFVDTTGQNNTFSITRASADSAPVISNVTNDNDPSRSVQVTVSLSDNGQGGTGLFYGRASTNNSDNVTSWQVANTFQQDRNTDFYYFASRSSDTGANNGLASTGVLESVGYISADFSISAQNVTFSGSSNATTSVTVLGTTAGDTIHVRNNSAPYTLVYGTAVAAGSTTVIPVTSGLPTAGNTTTYRLSATRPADTGGSGGFQLSSDTFTITRAADAAPSFTVTSDNAAAASVGLTFNFSDVGSGGDGNLYYAIDDTLGFTPPPFGWSQTAPSSQLRNTTRKYWVSRVSNGQSLASSFQLQVDYLAPDTAVTITPASQSKSAAGTASWTLNGTTANDFYRLEDGGGTLVASGSAAGTSIVLQADATTTPAWPNEGDTLVVQALASRDTSRGGSGNLVQIPTTSVSAELLVADTVPFPFFFTDVTNATVSATLYTYVQITGTQGSSQTASITSGAAKTAVSSSVTQPSAGSFTTANKSISENQYLHVQLQASSLSAITVSSTIQVGDVSDTWDITTAAGNGDYGFVVYDDNSNVVWTSGQPTKVYKSLPQIFAALYPPNLDSNFYSSSAIVSLEGVSSQADLEANYVLQSGGATTYDIFSNASDPNVEYYAPGQIRLTWRGFCVDFLGNSRPCTTSDVTLTTFYPFVIGKDI